jgi:hypothetical protein
MPTRKSALEEIYTSERWYSKRDAVNDTLVDYENVLLLRPATSRWGFANGASASARGGTLVGATIWSFADPIAADTIGRFEAEGVPALTSAGAPVVAMLVTEPSTNDYPNLPVREGENVLVWFTRFDDLAAYDAHLVARDQSPRWRALLDEIGDGFARPPDELRLVPTMRSRLA